MMFDTNKKNSKLYFAIIQQLYYKKSLSCVALSNLIDKSIPLVNKSLNYLIEKGYVIEEGYAASSGGRRPLMYALKTDMIYIVSVAMDKLSTRIVIVDLLNNDVSSLETIDLKLKDNTNALLKLTEAITEHISKAGIAKEKLLGVGIGMPGFVNMREGINYTYLNLGQQSIAEHISNKIQLPVFIDNDSSLIALSELKFGIAKSIKDAMVINLSWGIGLGMIINGQLFRGHSGFAGEFSHIPITEEGSLCSCGKQGCLEAEASLLAVAEKAISGLKEGKKTVFKYQDGESKLKASDNLMDAANLGDQYAIGLLSDSAYKIGKGIAILIHIINPRAIILSGRGVKVGRLFLAPIQQALNKYCIPRLSNNTEIYISDIGYDAELIGAAILVMENTTINQ